MFTEIVGAPEFWLFFVGEQCVAFLPGRAFDAGRQAEFDGFFAARQNAGAA